MSDFKCFQYQIVIKEHHLDTFSHVNNATYLELLEEARWEFLSSQGYGLKAIHELGMGPVVLECNIKFIKELRLRQTIVIESQMMSYEKKIGTMRQDILYFKENYIPLSKHGAQKFIQIVMMRWCWIMIRL